jgi:hypothetical protein
VATNLYGAADRVAKAGDTMTGALVLTGSPPLQIPASAASGRLLTSDASGNASWTAPSTTPISATRAITAATVTAAAWDVLECNATSNAITVTPPANTAGVRFLVKKTDSSANAVTISATVDGFSSPTLASQYQSMELVGDGANWYRTTRQTLADLVDYPATTDARYASSNNPIFQAYQLSGGGFTSGTPTAVGMDTTIVDNYSGHSNSTNNSRYVGKRSGYHRVWGIACVNGATSQTYIAGFIAKNGTETVGSRGMLPANSSHTYSVPTSPVFVFLNGTTDYVELYVQADGSGPSTHGSGTQTSSLCAEWVHS